MDFRQLVYNSHQFPFDHRLFSFRWWWCSSWPAVSCWPLHYFFLVALILYYWCWQAVSYLPLHYFFLVASILLLLASCFLLANSLFLSGGLNTTATGLLFPVGHFIISFCWPQYYCCWPSVSYWPLHSFLQLAVIPLLLAICFHIGHLFLSDGRDAAANGQLFPIGHFILSFRWRWCRFCFLVVHFF